MKTTLVRGAGSKKEGPMEIFEIVCEFVYGITPLIASLVTFIYGAVRFYKKGKALYLQMITTAVGCYLLSEIYELCQTLAFTGSTDGFTAVYLGRMGFFLFLLMANYGQIDGIVDDGSAQMKPARYVGIAAPIAALALYVIPAVSPLPVSTKIAYALTWIPAMFSLYFNLKHAVIRDLGFDFASAVRPYNTFAVLVTFTQLGIMCVRAYEGHAFCSPLSAALAIALSVLMIVMMRQLEKGVRRWTT